MKKVLFIFIIFIGFQSFAQEKLAEFTTENANIQNMGDSEMKIQFTTYKDSLVMKYLDKTTVKMMDKAGQPNPMTMNYTFEKKENNQSVWYEAETDEVKIMVIVPSNQKPSVKIQTYDSFSGTTTEQLYY